MSLTCPLVQPGYEACATLTNAEFESVFHLALLANNAKMINIYMV